MKFLVYLLLLVNLGLFAWLYTHQDSYRPAAPIAAAFPPSVEPLVLLRERGNVEPESPPNLTAPGARPRADAPSAVDEAPPVADSASPADVPVNQAGQDTGDTEMEPAPDDALTSAGEQPTIEPEPPPELPRICQTIGPFSAREQADAFMSELAALEKTPVLRTAQIEEPSDYWVYLPTMPRAEARRTVEGLAAKGVKDYFLDRQNFISLGVFSDKRSAESRLHEMVALGYQPRLEPRFLTREVYWVDFEERGPEYISVEQWPNLLNARTDLRRQPVACE